MRARSRAWALLLAPALLLAGCGGGDDGGGGTQATTPPQPAKVTVTATASGDQVSFDLPAQLKPGATELSLVNNTKEQVEFQLVQLDEGHTMAEFYPAIEEDGAPIPTWLHPAGGVGEASPGERRSVVVDLKAGNYAWFSNTTPEQEGAEPLYKRGGEGSLEVTGDPSGAALPATGAQITAKEVGPTDYRFETSGFKAGTNQITFTNGGGELHHVVIARLNDGATIDQAQEFFTTEDFKGPPPIDFDASEVTAVLDTGGKEVDTVELKSGSYALLCFLSDRAGSPPHVIKAKMIQEVKVP
jgi:hypothetical protein